MTVQDPGELVTITNREIYDVLVDVKSTVAPLPSQVSDHEVRIRAIEKYLWIWIGAAGILGAVASHLVTRLLAA